MRRGLLLLATQGRRPRGSSPLLRRTLRAVASPQLSSFHHRRGLSALFRPPSAPADTLMDVLVLALIGILLVANYKPKTTNLWAIGVFVTVAIYMNVLVRALDDPFDGPTEYHFRCYCEGREIELSYRECWKYGCMVNFACLTADFGKMMRILINQESESAATSASAALADAGSRADSAFHNPAPPSHAERAHAAAAMREEAARPLDAAELRLDLNDGGARRAAHPPISAVQQRSASDDGGDGAEHVSAAFEH